MNKIKPAASGIGFGQSCVTVTLLLLLGFGGRLAAAANDIANAKADFPAGSLPHTHKDWPHVKSAIAPDAAMENRIKAIVSAMTLPQKIGQMTQPEIKSITPAEVKAFYIGSVLNGGGSRPGGNKRADIQDWLNLSEQYYGASMATDMTFKVPVIWGTDAVHGHNNVFGATIFPHNIGLGAAHDAKLVYDIGAATGKAVRASGINWVFAPTLAVAQDNRWGRTYESFSEHGALIESYGRAYVQGLQGNLRGDGNVVATAKHFIGDGGTAHGKDQGITQANMATMINVHGRGYYGALSAGVQTVMASFNSWHDITSGIDYGKMHGSKILLTDTLKTKMGFDGFIVSDWNGIEQVPGCSKTRCAQAINAGIDMVMVPDDWREFIANTIRQVEGGEIPLARIDDAVARILRVKLRSGLFENRPSQWKFAGKPEALLARTLARRAVQESMVLLKNNGGALPLKAGQRILVVGKSADSLQNQTGGWTLSWQGTENSNADFPSGNTILAGVRDHAGANNVVFSETGTDIDPRNFDAVLAVIGETPYAEGKGDIAPTDTLRHSSRYPEDLAVLKAVSGKGRPVIAVLLSGRTVYANDLLNLSDAFVAAWLPGTEGKGVTDVLFRNAAGGVRHDFHGRLSFSWPQHECPDPSAAKNVAPLFARGYGLSYRQNNKLDALPVNHVTDCMPAAGISIFGPSSRNVAGLYVTSINGERMEREVGGEFAGSINLPESQPVVRAETSQINKQQDARKITWLGAARLVARSPNKLGLQPYAARAGALVFDVVVHEVPQRAVSILMACGSKCEGVVDATELFRNASGKGRQIVKIPLACFTARGVDLSKVDIPFGVFTEGSFSASFTNIEIVSEAGKDADAFACR